MIRYSICRLQLCQQTNLLNYIYSNNSNCCSFIEIKINMRYAFQVNQNKFYFITLTSNIKLYLPKLD